MKRSEVKSKLEAVKVAIAQIEKNDDVVLYITQNKHLTGVGYISEVESIGELVKAHNEIRKLSTNDFTESAKALGLSENEIPESDTKILGFKPAHWFADIETRLKELRTEIKLDKLRDAEVALTKHLSEDDMFEMDTVGIDELIAV